MREGGREGEEGAGEEGDNGRGLGGSGSFVFEIANGILRELWMNRRGMSRNVTYCDIQPSIEPFIHPSTYYPFHPLTIHLSSSSFINPSSTKQINGWMNVTFSVSAH